MVVMEEEGGMVVGVFTTLHGRCTLDLLLLRRGLAQFIGHVIYMSVVSF